MKPPKITIAGQDYRLKPTPPGQNGCHLCALLLWCFDNFQNMQCVDYEKDCYFIKEENHEDNSRNADSDNRNNHSGDDGHRDSGNAAPLQ